jgi:hypothetical protein
MAYEKNFYDIEKQYYHMPLNRQSFNLDFTGMSPLNYVISEEYHTVAMFQIGKMLRLVPKYAPFFDNTRLEVWYNPGLRGGTPVKLTKGTHYLLQHEISSSFTMCWADLSPLGETKVYGSIMFLGNYDGRVTISYNTLGDLKMVDRRNVLNNLANYNAKINLYEVVANNLDRLIPRDKERKYEYRDDDENSIYRRTNDTFVG